MCSKNQVLQYLEERKKNKEEDQGTTKEEETPKIAESSNISYATRNSVQHLFCPPPNIPLEIYMKLVGKSSWIYNRPNYTEEVDLGNDRLVRMKCINRKYMETPLHEGGLGRVEIGEEYRIHYWINQRLQEDLLPLPDMNNKALHDGVK